MPESREARQRPSNRDHGPILTDAFSRDLLRPPPGLDLAEWMAGHLILPAGASAIPGPVHLWPHQTGIADAICDPAIERVVVQKAARVGYSLLLGGVIGSYVANSPAPVLCIVPTEQDAKNFVTDQLESLFDASPVLRGKLSEGKRNRLLYRQFPGGWLRVVAAKAPRNLRAHTAKVVIFDEIDAFDISAGGEGDPIALGIKRSDTFRDRKIILGGTPIDLETSHVIREYNNSDSRVFEIPCPRCGHRWELAWQDIKWEEDRPETAHAECPSCGGHIEESEKASVVAQGQWRITKPEITNVAGFRLSALISTIPAAAWPKLAAEFLKAKRSPETLKPFINTTLGQGWAYRDGEGLSEHVLAARAEEFDLENNIPADVRLLTLGVDVQAGFLACCTIGHSATQMFVLDYREFQGAPTGEEVWQELHSFTSRRFKHALGGTLGFDAVAVDSGDGNTTDIVYSWTRPRLARRCVSIKGHDGNRPLIERSSKPGLFIVGVDGAKTRLYSLMEKEGHIRFSHTLPARFYEELCSERRVTHYRFGQPRKRWERIKGMRAEGLDSAVYAMAVRQLCNVDLTARENELRGLVTPPTFKAVHRSRFMSGNRDD